MKLRFFSQWGPARGWDFDLLHLGFSKFDIEWSVYLMVVGFAMVLYIPRKR